MIAKCIAVLAIVAQINALGCNQACVRTSGAAVALPPACGGRGVVTRNIIAKGKYPVAVNCGPVPDRRVPVTTSHVQAPVQEKPTVRLASRIPAPRTVAHTCTCYKTILRPRVHDHIITVPTIQRYIETTHTPVVENIHYEGVPVNCGCGRGSGCGCGTVPPVGAAGCGCGCGAVSQVGVAGCGCGCGSGCGSGAAVVAPVVPAVRVPQVVGCNSCAC